MKFKITKNNPTIFSNIKIGSLFMLDNEAFEEDVFMKIESIRVGPNSLVRRNAVWLTSTRTGELAFFDNTARVLKDIFFNGLS